MRRQLVGTQRSCRHWFIFGAMADRPAGSGKQHDPAPTIINKSLQFVIERNPSSSRVQYDRLRHRDTPSMLIYACPPAEPL